MLHVLLEHTRLRSGSGEALEALAELEVLLPCIRLRFLPMAQLLHLSQTNPFLQRCKVQL